MRRRTACSTLGQSGYEWAFIPEAGKTYRDSGAKAATDRRPASQVELDRRPPPPFVEGVISPFLVGTGNRACV